MRHDDRVNNLLGYDGTRLAYSDTGGDGSPLVCLPGGAMMSPDYLGDLGGLFKRRLVVLHLRGTGASATPDDPASYRCDRQVDDVEALREHLGLDRLNLLGHSAGVNLAVRYAERHPDRVARLVLVTPSARAVDLDIAGDERVAAADQRRGELPDAVAALERIVAGAGGESDWDAVTPLTYGRWDEAARAHAAASDAGRNAEAAGIFNADGAFDPPATRAALAALGAPALVLGGEYDVSMPPPAAARYAGLLANAELAVQPGGGHFPWLDDPAWFADTVAAFLD
jgi:proline iminopeptidase